MRLAGHVALVMEIINTCKVFIEKREGKKSLGRTRHRSVGNINWILKK
jgi:hypothetical protein